MQEPFCCDCNEQMFMKILEVPEGFLEVPEGLLEVPGYFLEVGNIQTFVLLDLWLRAFPFPSASTSSAASAASWLGSFQWLGNTGNPLRLLLLHHHLLIHPPHQ